MASTENVWARSAQGRLLVVIASLACALGGCSGGQAEGSQPNPASSDSLAPPTAPTASAGEPSPTPEATSSDAAPATSATAPTARVAQSTSTTTTTSGGPPNTGIAEATSITVASQSIDVAAAVGVDQAAHFGDGVSVRVVAYEALEVVTALPREIGGEVVQVDIEFANESPASVDLGNVTVDLRFGGGRPAGQVTTAPADPVAGVLEPSGVVVGRYIFNVPVDERDAIELFVSYAATAPTIVIKGSFA